MITLDQVDEQIQEDLAIQRASDKDKLTGPQRPVSLSEEMGEQESIGNVRKDYVPISLSDVNNQAATEVGINNFKSGRISLEEEMAGYRPVSRPASHGLMGAATEVLSVGENATVKALRILTGADDRRKVPFRDNTFKDMLVGDFGMKDNLITDGIAFGLNIVNPADPINKLTFGLGKVGKALKLEQLAKLAPEADKTIVQQIRDAKVLTNYNEAKKIATEQINKQGIFSHIAGSGQPIAKKDVRKAIEDRASVIVKENEDKVAELSRSFAERGKIRLNESGWARYGEMLDNNVKERLSNTQFEVNDMLSIRGDMIGPESSQELINKYNKIHAEESDKLNSYFANKVGSAETQGLYDQGGIKLYGKTIVAPKTIQKVLDKIGLPKMLDKIQNPAWMPFLKGETLGEAIHITQKIADPLIEENKYVTDLYKAALNRLNALEDQYQKEYMKAPFFKGMTPEEGKEFSDLMCGVKQPNGTYKGGLRGQEEAFRAQYKSGTITKKELDLNVAKLEEQIPEKFKSKMPLWHEFTQTVAREAGIPEKDHIKYYHAYLIGDMQNYKATLPKLSKLSPAKREFLREATTEGELALRDPLKVLTIRRLTVAAANIQDELYHQIARDMGRTFKNDDAAKLAGYVKLTSKIDDVARDSIKIKNTLKELNNIYVPAKIHGELIAKMGEMPVNNPITNLFGIIKSHLLYAFPAYHFRNMLNNGVQLMDQMGGKMLTAGKMHERVMTAMMGKEFTPFKDQLGRIWTKDDFMKGAIENGIISTNMLNSEMLYATTQKGLKGSAARVALERANPLSTNFLWTPEGRQLASTLETYPKLLLYGHWLEKGLSPKMAAREAIDTFFDYGALEPWEAKLRSYLIPFYTWSRKNLEYQVKLAASRPGVIANRLKFWRDFGPSEEEWENMPEWSKRKFGLKYKGMIYNTGIDPLEDIAELSSGLQNVFGRVHAPIKWIMEHSFDRDFNTGRKLSTMRTADEFRFMYALANSNIVKSANKLIWGDQVADGQDGINLARKLGRWMDLKEDEDGHLTANPDILHAFRNFGASRWMSTLGAFSKEDMSLFQTLTKVGLGITPIDPDDDYNIFLNNKKDYQDYLIDPLVKRNMVEEFGAGGYAMKKAFPENVRKQVNKKMREALDKVRNKQGERIDKEELIELRQLIEEQASKLEGFE